jgi:hypothetical protein
VIGGVTCDRLFDKDGAPSDQRAHLAEFVGPGWRIRF